MSEGVRQLSSALIQPMLLSHPPPRRGAARGKIDLSERDSRGSLKTVRVCFVNQAQILVRRLSEI